MAGSVIASALSCHTMRDDSVLASTSKILVVRPDSASVGCGAVLSVPAGADVVLTVGAGSDPTSSVRADTVAASVVFLHTVKADLVLVLSKTILTKRVAAVLKRVCVDSVSTPSVSNAFGHERLQRRELPRQNGSESSTCATTGFVARTFRFGWLPFRRSSMTNAPVFAA